MKKEVTKSLSPEEKAILGNIKSLLEQLDAEETSEEIISEEVVEEAANEEEVGEEDDREEVEKSEEPDETARNSAAERTCAEDTDTEEALAILKSYLKKGRVDKSAVRIAQLERQVSDLTLAMEGILDGLNVPGQIRKSRLYDRIQREQQREATLTDVMNTLFRG